MTGQDPDVCRYKSTAWPFFEEFPIVCQPTGLSMNQQTKEARRKRTRLAVGLFLTSIAINLTMMLMISFDPRPGTSSDHGVGMNRSKHLA